MMERRPLVTIAIPTFNRAQTYLPQVLGCALAQTYPNIEVIVSDNCSTDNTSEVIANHHDQRVRYFRHARPVVPNDNFNFCLSQARGEYFLLLLDDELIDATLVEICVGMSHANPKAGLIRTGLRIVDINGVVVQEIPNLANNTDLAGLFMDWFAGRTTFYLCNTLFRTEALRSIGGLQSRHNLFQDVMAQVRVVATFGRIDIKHILASTRSHTGQSTYAAKVIDWVDDSLDLLALMQSVIDRDHGLIRARGRRFFASICYSRANAIRSPVKRVMAYRAVYNRFGRQCLPPVRMILASTALYRQLRNIKRRLKGQPSWAAAG